MPIIGQLCVVLTSIVAVLTGLAFFKFYDSFITVPELPNFELDKWWGPNTTKPLDTSIRPYRVVFTDAMQENLRVLFDHYRGRRRVKSLNESWSYGVHSDALGQVFAHWQFKYPFRERVRYLNKFNHFKTNIQGLDIHFVHVKPKVDKNVKVLPIILLHGWPSSFRDFFEVIPILTTPRPGYDFVFEVIVPSLPGFVYSQATTKRGMTTYEIAIIMRNLMRRIGHNKYYIQGGDFGHSIGSHMATLFSNEVLGFHTNFPVNFSKLAQLIWVFGSIWPTIIGGEHSDRMYPLSEKLSYLIEESGYMHLQGTKPDTIGYALQNSPVGMAAYMLDRYMMFTNSSNKDTVAGGLESISVTDLLDNVMLYWITDSMTTSLRLYKESFVNYETEQILGRIPTTVPTWGLRMKYELVHQPNWILKWKYPALLGTTTLDVGGHFAALERPRELADDIFKAIKNFLEH
ncbi:unnamed protein product [Parnassius apollo]|uniref:Epoxide hydrolase n=1 Tax=Parnassius apollo TaxID=110799 RepID=A0A8S3XLG3_PARAO|nr:unnamed protein product [Parnassius apollo]